ncbi:MAG: hypothetical protein EXR81_00850 [Gammaproteobacteria bacterium]|nr:hypothetical protein [Gammaproteobacteria bacterium]
MTNKAISPEDILSDNESFVQYEGGTIRKGSFAAIIANADILDSSNATPAEKAAALDMIRSLLPAIMLSGAAKHLIWKNPQIQQSMDELAHHQK